MGRRGRGQRMQVGGVRESEGEREEYTVSRSGRF